VQASTNYEKMIYSITLARTGTVLPAVREITGIKKKLITVQNNFG
jgi:hypothetical protein